MEKPSKMHDLAEKKVNAPVKTDLEKWKRRALYNMPPDKPRPESTSNAAQEGIPYRDGPSLLARQRQQTYQQNRDLSDHLGSMHLRPSSNVQHKFNAGNSTSSELGEPKGEKGKCTVTVNLEWDGEDKSDKQKNEGCKKKKLYRLL